MVERMEGRMMREGREEGGEKGDRGKGKRRKKESREGKIMGCRKEGKDKREGKGR